MTFKPTRWISVKQSDMKAGKDILGKVGKVSYRVPEGYFEGLKDRLEAIPAGKTAEPGIWMRVRPYVAMAACFAIAFITGDSILRHTAMRQGPSDLYNEISYAELISMTRPESLFLAMESEHDDLSDEDIINYLIEAGVTTDHLEYAGLQK